MERAVFGGGCFWCTEAVFQNLRGVRSVTSGFAGGQIADPSYEDVVRGSTGHIEVIKIIFDPSVISYETLLEVFAATHDPTSRDKQGADEGEQYRSVIFYTTQEQKNAAETYIAAIPGAVTEIHPLDVFYKAEEDHQSYYLKNKTNPYCQVVINPKLKKLQEQYGNLIKQT